MTRRQAAEDVSGLPSMPTIIYMVAGACAVTEVDILSARRDQRSTGARWIAMWICRRLTRFSYPDIGRAFGDRDHTTIMHGVARTTERMAREAPFRERVLALKAAIEREALGG